MDLKQTAAGVLVIEINDNPNLDVGAEDQILGDEVYQRLLSHLLAKVEARNGLSVSERPSLRTVINAKPYLELSRSGQ